MSNTQKWIDLRDKQSGAKLKLDLVNGDRFLFVIGMSQANPKWKQAINELGFIPSSNNKFLIRLVQPDERIKVATFQKVWPDAAYAEMPADKIGLNLNKPAQGQQRSAEERDIANELANARRLGRNADGDEVYEASSGRFIYRQDKGIVSESRSLRPSMFLRAQDAQGIDECADGFVRSMMMNEVLRADDMDRFIYAVTGRKGPVQAADIDMAHEVIDAAVARCLVREYETANDAYGDSVRLYEYMPAYRGSSRGNAAMPGPLAVIAQRLLGDTTGKTVILPNAFDGAGFSFLPKGTNIHAFRGGRDLSARAQGLTRDGLQWHGGEFHAVQDSNADAMFFNADASLGSDGSRADYRSALLALRSMAPDGRAVLVLSGDDPLRPGVINAQSRTFYESIYSRYEIEDAFEVGRELTKVVGTNATLRLISVRNRAPAPGEDGGAPRAPGALPTCHSWDDVKARVDETIARVAVREAQSDGIDLEKTIADNLLQRPYLAFSKVGEATTMVPKELQQPLQAFMSDLEAQYGPVDEFIKTELRLAGDVALGTWYSPEQVDALAMMIYRMKRGRGHILGDETGIGKGRTLAGLTTWALKQDRPVVFVTDRANLFSDLARDLRDIGEWGRVRPFVMNSDGKVEDNIGDAGVLAQGIKSGDMKRILENNMALAETGCNVVFTTYSQLSGEGSEKSVWLKNQLKDALLVVDEAHVAAGSDSNISTQIAEMTSIAWGVQYSSATWAKSAANLHIFARAFPESVNVGTLSQTMKRGGEAFSEIFSSMLAREGALMRREHDLSKLEFVLEVDHANAERNSQVADRVAEVMSALAYTAGSLKRIVTRVSDVNISALRDAREVRIGAQATQVFKSRFGTGSMLYQVNRRINAALNVDNAVRLALEGIAAGRKPVIVFEDTGESFIKQALEAQAVTLPDGSRALPQLLMPPTIKDLLLRIVQTLEMVRVQDVSIEDLPAFARAEEDGEAVDEEQDPQATLVDQIPGVNAPPEGNAPTDEAPGAEPAQAGAPADEPDGVVVADAANAVALAQASEAPRTRGRQKPKPKYKLVPFWEIESISENDRKTFEEGIAEVKRLIDSLPSIALNAPDEINRRLTSNLTAAGDRIRVGELSGRSFTLMPQDGQGGLCRVIPRPKNKSYVNATTRAFNGGQLDVLLINRSAATGISLHASPRFSDRRRRQLIEMQIPENPTDRIQLYGRVNRYDQESFPLIQVASTGIYGEVRQIMVQNKKLSEMSANVRSSRESHAVIKEVPDLLNALGREVCRQFLQDNPEILSRLDMSPADIEPESHRDLAVALTSRIPLLRMTEQKQTYEQLYAMFEDAIVQAELAGNNPLKPNELDVRGKLGTPRLLFGFDHKGVGSAFDGAVFAQRIDWTEDVRPMSLEVILDVVRINREKLIQSGRATQGGRTPGGASIVDMSDLAKRASKQLEGRARLSVAGTEFKSSDEAMTSGKPNPVRRGLARANWIAANLPKLTPGRIISMPRSDAKEMSWLRRNAIILDIVPPADKRESQLAQWRVLTISPGESKPISTTLNALVGELMLDVPRASDRAGSVSNTIEAFSRLEIGADVIEMSEATSAERRAMHNSWIYRDFEHRFVGERDRKALVLTGNMYLASEWAAQTKAGTGVIFTDDRGLRHRGIILKDTFKPEWLRFLPARLWMPGMINRFVDKLAAQELPLENGRYVMHSSFNGAWNSTSSSTVAAASVKDQILVIPGQGVMMHIGKDGRRRVNAMLRQAQKVIKEKAFPGVKVRPQDDPGHVTIKESAGRAARATARGDDAVSAASRKEAEFIVMTAETPEKLKRAFQMLMNGPGLEIFVAPGTELGEHARVCMRDYYIERLRAEAQGDPVRIAKLEEIVQEELTYGSRGAEIERDLQAIRLFNTGEVDAEQMDIDFDTGEPIVREGAPAPALADDQDVAEVIERPRMAA